MNLIEAIKSAGIVGAGGAGFPTHIKLNAKAECLIINAAECEPLIETDKYICRTYAKEVVETVLVIAEQVGANRIVIALKGKYHGEIESLKQAITALHTKIEIFEMKTFYPAGDEQTMVEQVCGLSIPERGLPLDVGVVVQNVGTVFHIYEALQGKPVTRKFLSVVGEVEQPIMLRVPIGTPIRACIEKANPTIAEYAVILGGPMMGKVLTTEKEIDQAVVTKTTGNLLVLPREHYLIRRFGVSITRIRMQAQSACIQCHMCTDLCPRYLIGQQIRPHKIMRNLVRESTITTNEVFAEAFGEAVNCCDCGVCEMFACPMGLSPRKINGYMKQELRKRDIKIERDLHPVKRIGIENHKTPTHRLIARLNLSKYDGLHAENCYELVPNEVFIPFSQHIGKKAIPVCQVGEQVNEGELLAKAEEQGLSANIHVSMTGIITEITDVGARIHKKEG